MSKKLLKSGLVVSLMTFISRILGLTRDVVIANLLGANAASDVFLFANKIPNFLRRLFAEGAFAQAFVPVLAEVKEEGDKDSMRLFIARTAGTLGVIVTIVTILGVIGSPVLAALFGTGWFVDHLQGGELGYKYEQAATMLKITFPYLWFVTLVGLSGAILNTLNKFAVAAFTPVLLNVAIISCAIYLSPTFEQPAYGLAWGVFIGGVVQLLFQLPFLWRAGVLVKPRWGWRDEKVSKVRKLIIPALFGVSVGQINLLLDTVIATSLITGSISWLYYSDRLMEFPLGLFGIAIATIILPTLSNNYVKADLGQFQNNMDWAVRMVCLLGLPAATGLAVLAEPLMLVMFQRGEFTLEHATLASYSLIAYAVGLFNFMLVKVLAPGFYSRQDTKTPVRYGIWCMFANMAFNLILVLFLGYQWGYIGLAIATSLSAMLNVGLLYQRLHRDGVFQVHASTLWFLARIVLVCVMMALVVLEMSPAQAVWQGWGFWPRVQETAKLIAIAVVVYLFGLVLFGVRPRHLQAANAKAA